MRIKKLLLWCIAGWFFIQQNFFFDWNATPQSLAALIAEGIGLLLIAVAVNAS